MKRVGVLFGDGKMFSSSVYTCYEAAVAILLMMESSKNQSSSQGTYVIATVKGDVHDIGKNIVPGIVKTCYGSVQRYYKAIQENNADIVGLSGLITPSLDEMISNAKNSRSGINIPLMIGGATTNATLPNCSRDEGQRSELAMQPC